ncbi:MAG: potassium-transporting ATPase subunit C [Planctomycetaceae bacterium]|nr:potassium-transporting ATPase subunit C [Planctomycetaceae bacterium]
MKHVRANLLLLGLSFAICCIAYPSLLWAIGQTIFLTKSNGSLMTGMGQDGTQRTIGSRQIAQSFTGDEYFWPRPSAASYNATAAGGSNWGANNPKLRDRVAQQLGPIIRYKPGTQPRTPQQDIEDWFAAKPDRAADWAREYSVAAANWAMADSTNNTYGLQGNFILAWAEHHPDLIEQWKNANRAKTDHPKPVDLIPLFFVSFARAHPGKWPAVVEVKQTDGSVIKQVEPVAPDASVHANFFDMWLQDPANRPKTADLEPVPADMVTASGSGLDPHITLRNAMSVYQFDRVAAKRTLPGGNAAKIRNDIEKLVRKHSFTPLCGLVGEPLVNLLELNVDLDRHFTVPSVR